jgi:uncharacterized protein
MNLHIDVCYALPGGASFMKRIELRDGATVRDSIDASGVLALHPEIDLSAQKVGVFGRATPLDATLADFDRVEIYRGLLVDPKMARQRRVDKTRRAGSIEGRKWQSKESR